MGRNHALLISWVLLAAAAASAQPAPPSPAEIPACPEGTVGAGAPPPEGDKIWCENTEGKRQGPYTKWHANGSVWTRGGFRDHRKEGWWRIWDERGQILYDREYRRGQLIARRRHGNEVGDVRMSVPSDPVHPCPQGSVVAGTAGKKQWCEKRRADGSYALHGTWIDWFSSEVVWHRQQYRDGKREGIWLEYWSNGSKKREVSYRDDQHHGPSTYYDENGTVRSVLHFRDGEVARDQRTAYYHANGNLREEIVRDDEGETVRHSHWFENGNKRSEGIWQRDRITHHQREWWPNGQLKAEGDKQKAQKIGNWRSWNDDGQLLKIENHVPGGVTEREVFAVYAYTDPEWAPRPVPRGDERAPSGYLSCPRGSRKKREAIDIGVGSVLEPLSDSGDLDAQEILILKALNLIRFPVGHREACVQGFFSSEKTGPAIEYSEDGIRSADGSYRVGRKHGIWKQWESDGSKAAEYDYRDGKLVRAIVWHANGNTHSIHHYEDGREHGAFATWYPNGARRVIGGHQRGETHGPWMWHLETGFRYEQGEFRNGQKHGVWMYWRHDGHKNKEQEFQDGVPHGRYVELLADGTPHVQGAYRDGERHGTWVGWSKGRKKSEVSWLHGLRHGSATTWRDNGQLRDKGKYERGRRIGPWALYDKHGNAFASGEYVWCERPPKQSVARFESGGWIYQQAGHGCKTGLWTYWRDDSSVRDTYEFDEINDPGPQQTTGAVMM